MAVTESLPGGWVVETVTDDMPLLFESLKGSLEAAGCDLVGWSHPVLGARRDAAGQLQELSATVDGTARREDELVESWIRFNIRSYKDGPQSEQDLSDLASVVLADVRRVNDDRRSMRDHVATLADRIDAAYRSSGEAVDRSDAEVVRWLIDDHFIVLGVAERREGQTEDSDADVVSLGLASKWFEAAPGALTHSPSAVAMWFSKLPITSTVHRSHHPDVVSVPVPHGTTGAPVGGGWVDIFGFYSPEALNADFRRSPVTRSRVARILQLSGFAPGGHSERTLLRCLQAFPLEELLSSTEESVLKTAKNLLGADEMRTPHVVMRNDKRTGMTTLTAFIPRNRYSAAAHMRIRDAVIKKLGTQVDSAPPHLIDSEWARLYFTANAPAAALVATDALIETVAQCVRDWQDETVDAAISRLGSREGRFLVDRWVRGLPDTYRAAQSPADCVEDLLKADRLLSGPPDGAGASSANTGTAEGLALRPATTDGRTWRLRLSRTVPVALSDLLPAVANLGVDLTDERPDLLTRDDGAEVWVYDIGLRLRTEPSGDIAAVGRRLGAALAAAWSGRTESDPLSRLVLAAGLDWTQVALLRAVAQYARQAGLPYTLEYIAATLEGHHEATTALIDYFEARFRPTRQGGPDHRPSAVATAAATVEAAIQALETQDSDRIVSTLYAVLGATARTNYFQRVKNAFSDPATRDHIVLKLTPRLIPGMPKPVPTQELWVHGPRVEGVHLRFGAVARGGIRWTDRREDFRTEILGLVKAQIIKNALIVPTGAKGGFLPKQLPSPAAGGDAVIEEARASYVLFIAALLSVTDNLETSRAQRAVIAPPGVVRHDGDDPYLVVAADKGTATFSDLANTAAMARNFWLGDAFASGGSRGFDHKALGITARGAWASVEQHLRELSFDLNQTPLTAVGIGDMGGDVFGNGMLLSRNLLLVGAFNHTHIFLDPDPDPERSFQERARLFTAAKSGWDFYDPAVISAGGGVFRRDSKTVPVSSAVAERLGLSDGPGDWKSDDLVRAILSARVDLLWNGGIGTYVKASSETHQSVGDKANDTTRIDAKDLRVQVIGEGGNLGLTQRGRVEAAQSGVLLNTDAIDNSAGVDCSDHEVNIKVLLDQLVAEDLLSTSERDDLLSQTADDVAMLVLDNNKSQNRLLSVERHYSAAELPAHRRFMTRLELEGTLDPELESLPVLAELNRRGQEGVGLTSPELAVLVAYAKITLASAVLAGTAVEDDWAVDTLNSYFPAKLRVRFAESLPTHPLRREIATTVLVNEIVDTAGITFAFRAASETGATYDEVVRAYMTVIRIFGVRDLVADVAALDGQVSTATQARLTHEQQRLIDRGVRWFIRRNPRGIDVAAATATFSDSARKHGTAVHSFLVGRDHEYVEAHASQLIGAGVPAGTAKTTAGLLYQYALLDIIEVAAHLDHDVAHVAHVWFVLSERYGALPS